MKRQKKETNHKIKTCKYTLPVCGPMFRDTGDRTLMTEPQSPLDRGSGFAPVFITLLAPPQQSYVISTGSSPRSLTSYPRTFPTLLQSTLDLSRKSFKSLRHASRYGCGVFHSYCLLKMSMGIVFKCSIGDLGQGFSLLRQFAQD